MNEIPEYINGLPNISGSEALIEEAIEGSRNRPVFLPDSTIDFGAIKSACAVALHMQQPLIPAGGDDLGTAELISNLQYMMQHPDIGDNHNAAVFHWCYKRMGEFIPQLVGEGKQPRVMLDYSGVLLHGLRHMGLNDVIDELKTITLIGLPVKNGVARLHLGPCGRAVDADPGFPPARQGLATPLRVDLRHRGGHPRTGLLTGRDGTAQPSRRRI